MAGYISSVLMTVRESQEYANTPVATIIPALPGADHSVNHDKLASRCESLQQQVALLESDKQHLAHKLDS